MRRVFGLLLFLLPVIASAQSGVDGTWRIDMNKAQLDAKPMVYELKNGMFSCSTCDPKVNIKADGTDQPVTGSPYVDTESVTVVDTNTIQREGKKNGTVSFRDTLMISSDGKAFTRKYEAHPAGTNQVVTATGMYSRLGAPESGAHAISGSWKINKWDSVSDNSLTFVYAFNGDGLNYKANTGESYSAKFDGKDYPYHGDPGTTSVSLKKIDDHTFQETYKRNGEVVGMGKVSVSADGKSLTLVSQDSRRGTTDTFVAEKQSNTMADK
jgi:hypothetical protein